MQLDGSQAAKSSQDISGLGAETASSMLAIRDVAPQFLKRLQQGASKFELAYTPHTQWPLRLPRSSKAKLLKISILDSSFNPPTLAHLSLANLRPSQSSDTNLSRDYDAKLLLLSVKNADKTLKPGDARYQQRLEMMSLLAKSMNALDNIPSPSALSLEQAANVAIGIIDEPTFVGKSTVILAHLKGLLSTFSPPGTIMDSIELTFLVGLDTLERLFSARYYPSEEAMMESLRQFLSPDGEGSRIVCARRAASGSGPDAKAMALAKEFIDSGRIAIIDMGDEISRYSSTTVRRSVGSLGQDDGSAGSWRRLVTKDIAHYIVANHLYETEL